MKKVSAVLCVLFLASNAFAATHSDSKTTKSKHSNSNLGFGTGKGFIGGEVGLGGVGNVSIGVLGGYQYYFKPDWQFNGFRHGVRGIASLDWSQYSALGFWSGTSYNAMSVQVGADWTIDFNPKDRYVWGAYVGLSLGYFKVFSTFIDPSTFVWSGNLGGSLTISNTHRFELSLGSGFYYFGLRYMYMF